MARRRRGRSGGGKNFLMRGIVPMRFGMKGVAGAVIAGGLVGYVASRYLPQYIGNQDKIAGFAVGGIPGVVGAVVGAQVLPGLMGGMGIGSGTQIAQKVYG